MTKDSDLMLDQPITRREFYQFHLKREAGLSAMAAFIFAVVAVSFGGSAIWSLLSGGSESLGRDAMVGLLAVIIAVGFYRQFGRIRARQGELDNS